MEHEHHEHHQKKLYRSKHNKVFLGICGGLGEYFDIDPVVIRLFWLLAVIFSGIFPGLVAYILSALLIPKHP
ncbi:PspC domain-containing protein [Candidatus Parcubacteria bacterium]|nr:PspC domain-containing protein [Candidatus Parcubacteria bacterium]